MSDGTLLYTHPESGASVTTDAESDPLLQICGDIHAEIAAASRRVRQVMATHAYLSASRQGILAVILLAVGMVEPVVDGWRRLVLVIVELG
jgi:hypothetical protein